MTIYTIGTITNVREPQRGTVCIIAENQEKQLFRISNGMKQWTISASQLEAHGWQMVKGIEMLSDADVCAGNPVIDAAFDQAISEAQS